MRFAESVLSFFAGRDFEKIFEITKRIYAFGGITCRIGIKTKPNKNGGKQNEKGKEGTGQEIQGSD